MTEFFAGIVVVSLLMVVLMYYDGDDATLD